MTFLDIDIDIDIFGYWPKNTIIVREFYTPLILMDRSSKQKTNKVTKILNDRMEQVDLKDIFRTLHLKKWEYTFFASSHGTFSRIDHVLRDKTNVNKFKNIEIISRIYSAHSVMKLEINHR